jgi:AcrR family transcriptional regulator
MSTERVSIPQKITRALPGARTRRAPRSGSRASGERTRLEILRAAKHVLATQGYARFRLRSVAAAAGLTVGNLAYHYPSKRQLVRALIPQLIDEYRVQIDTHLRTAKQRPASGFGALVVWLMRDSVSPQTSRLFRELWTIALHDEFIATAVDSFYAEVQETAAAHLRRNFPDLPTPTARAIVQLMGIISEGSNVLYATARRPTAPLSRVTRLAADLLVQAAQDSRSARETDT